MNKLMYGSPIYVNLIIVMHYHNLKYTPLSYNKHHTSSIKDEIRIN